MFFIQTRAVRQQLLSLAVVCRVAGGLDSLIMGEGQILAQVKQVYKVGQDCPGFGRHLTGLFKQVRGIMCHRREIGAGLGFWG